MNEDAVDYTSGPYQQFTEEPRMQELDIIDEKEELVQDAFMPKTKKRSTKNRGTKKGSKKKKGTTKRSFLRGRTKGSRS